MSDLSLAAVWHNTFKNWPAHFKRKGVVAPIGGGESIPFVDFVMTDNVVVLERATPDNSGARRVAIPFSVIETLKYTEPLKTEQFLEAGYKEGGMAKDKPKRVEPVQPAAPIIQAAPQAAAAPAQQQAPPIQQQAPPAGAPTPVGEVAPTFAPQAVSEILRQAPPSESA